MMSDDLLEKIAFLFLGWLLGLLAPVIVDGIKRRRENKMGRQAICNDLTLLRFMLISAVYRADDYLGVQTKDKLQWMLERIPVDDNEIRPSIEMQLKLSDAQFNVAVIAFKNKGNGTLRLQKYGTPFLDARVSAMWSFSTKSQRTLLRIKAEMGFLSDTVDQLRYFNDQTFKELSSENHQIAVQSSREAIDTYARQARSVVELIDKFL